MVGNINYCRVSQQAACPPELLTGHKELAGTVGEVPASGL
jgi:hypothetical protein